jgi:hypothetical protein
VAHHSDSHFQALLAALHIPSYILQITRSLFPQRINETPQLLQDGQLIDAAPKVTRIGRGTATYAEDLVIWARHQLAILSTDPGRRIYNAFTGEGDEVRAGNGSLKIYYLGSDPPQFYDLSIADWPEGRSFHPLGINILEVGGSGNSEALLAIANCMSKDCAIEVIRITFNASTSSSPPIMASYLHSLEHANITAPNALVILSERQILFTNSFKYPPRKSILLNTIEQFISLPGGSVNVLTYDPAQGKTFCSTVIGNIALANGLALNKEKTILAVASSTARYVRIFDLSDISKGVTSKEQFKLRRTIHVGMMADNLRFCKGEKSNFGTLICAGHPDPLAFVRTAKNPNEPYRSSSMVVKIKIPKSSAKASLLQNVQDQFTLQDKEAVTVFTSKGEFYGTSSTAETFISATGETDMLVCGLFEDGILVCKNVDI